MGKALHRTPPDWLPEDEHRPWTMMRLVLPVGAIVHLGYAPGYIISGMPWLVLQAVLSMALWLWLTYLARTRWYRTARTFAAIEAVMHATVFTYVLGLGSGFVFYFFPLLIAAFLIYPLSRRLEHRIMVGLTLICAIAVFIVIKAEIPAWVALDPVVLEVMFWINLIGCLALCVLVPMSFHSLSQKLEGKLREARKQADSLLLNVLPPTIAHQLKASSQSIANHHDHVSILFLDIVGFTPLSQKLPPKDLVDLLNRVFSHFDDLVDAYGLEKIKTIGDAYMVASGIPEPRVDHAQAIASLALDMNRAMHENGLNLDVRMGIHTGSVVAGVIGKRKFIYDLWGDTVNTAARMESHSLPGRIQVTDAFRQAVADTFQLEKRGEIDVKGKGLMTTWFLIGRTMKDVPRPANAVAKPLAEERT